MKNKIKNKLKTFFKCYLPGFILGIISACTISVIAATYFPSNQTTYDNTNTELKSENVQDAIDELYGVCFPPKAGDQIIENAGLEKDPYECRYFFTGANPNNYITFNNESWRIISVECDGSLKIISNNVLGPKAFDSGNINNWETSEIKAYLNNEFLKSIEGNKDKIISHTWSIGGLRPDINDNLAEQIYMENGIKSQEAYIGMITLSEYLRTNSNVEQCGNINLNNDNRNSCITTNWLFKKTNWWTISPFTPSSDVMYLHFMGFTDCHDANDDLLGFAPTLYLSADITLTGSGTQSDPYVVS